MYNRFQHQEPTLGHDPSTQSSPERGITKNVLSSTGSILEYSLTKENCGRRAHKGNNRERAKLTDLCALGSTLLLETGVEEVTLTDTGEVVA